MNNIWSMVGEIMLAFSPIVGGLLILFAIGYVGNRHDERIHRERKRQSFLGELQKSDLKKAIADRDRSQQSHAVAASAQEHEDQAFIDAISEGFRKN